MSIFSKTDNLSKIAIYKLYLEVEVLGLDIRDWWVRVFINQLTDRCWQSIYHSYYPDLFQAVSVLWNINMCYLIPTAEIYDYTNIQASVSFFSTCLGNFHAFLCLLIFSKHPFLKSSFKNKMKQFGSWSGSMICQAWSGFKLFFKVSADGSDRQNAHKTSKIKKTQLFRIIYCANITLYIVYDRISTHTCFLGNCSCFLSSADFSSKYFLNNSSKHNTLYPNVKQFVPWSGSNIC